MWLWWYEAHLGEVVSRIQDKDFVVMHDNGVQRLGKDTIVTIAVGG
jgi:hypothetical protein